MGGLGSRRAGRGMKETGSKEQRGVEGGFEPRVEEGPHALGRVSGREGCAGGELTLSGAVALGRVVCQGRQSTGW